MQQLQRIRGGTIEDALRELQPALYEGRVKGRFGGVRYHTFRHDGIEPSAWHRAAVLLPTGAEILPTTGAVIFNYDGRPIVTNPAHPNYLPLCQVEICWADVLQWCLKNKVEVATGTPKDRQGDPLPTAPASAKDRNKPGPKPKTLMKCKAKMLADLTEGRRTVEELEQDTLAALVAAYGGSPNTAKKARDEAIAEFQSYSEFQRSEF
jgi:hypothetical protein